MSETAAVGFIGLGNIGAPMAKRLLEWPGGLVVRDVVPEATAPFSEQGAVVASSPAEVAERATVISVMVRDDAQVADVLDGPNGILRAARPGTVVAIHSTVEADSPARFAEMAATHDVHVVDAPVSGGAMGAADGSLAFMVGGTEEAFALVEEPFKLMGSLVARMGGVGAGTRAKLARNLVTFASYAAVGEAMRLAEASGVDLALLGDVIRHSDRVTGGPGAIAIRPTAAPMSADDGLRPIFGHTRQLGEKDLSLAIMLGSQRGLDLPIAAEALESLHRALGFE